MRISVYNSQQLRAVILALKRLDRETRKHIRQETKRVVAQEWTRAVREHATTRLEHRVLADTARVRVSDQNLTLSSATVGRRLSGGLNPKENYPAVEFGADRDAVRAYTARSRKGKSFTVNRRTSAQLRRRNRKGYAVYPAAASIIPRIAALWTQTVVRGLHDALEAR